MSFRQLPYALGLSLLAFVGCVDEPIGEEGLGIETSGDGDGDGGDGDGDGEPGDGDGEPGDGDGDGDGDGEPGDGDPGDGDGDGEPGDGDGDPNACAMPSNGVGGGSGQAAVAAPAYPNTPAVIYVPQSYDPSVAMPVMLALHGSGDTAGNFVNLWSGIAEAEGFIVLVPESLSGGASWNPGGDTQVISDLLDHVISLWNVEQCRIYLTGYSAGAHYGYMLGLANSTYFAALGVQAGSLSYAEMGGIWPGMVDRAMAVDIHHGVNDLGVPFSHAEHARDELEGAGHVVYFHTHQGGHEVGAGNPEQMWANISMHTVDEN
jgi:dienelactone hydrolase